jgi:poly(glycerol-phosphate) alpha-glucosyltransferase
MKLSRLEESGWELAIIGGGPEEQLLRDAIRDSGLTRTGINPTTADLASWYNRASLTLVTAKLEVFSLVLAEAMSAGIVPVAYATDGPSFILRDFPDHLVPIGDVQALADRLRSFAEREIAEPLRSNLSQEIESRFSPEVIAGEWRKLFDEAR